METNIENLSAKEVMERYGHTKKDYNAAIRKLKKIPEQMYDDIYQLLKKLRKEKSDLKDEVGRLERENEKFKKLYYDLYEEGIAQNKSHTPIMSVDVKVDNDKSILVGDELLTPKNIDKANDKSILVGDEQLIPKSDWIKFSEMDSERKILDDKFGIFNDAFQKILNEHTMNSKILFMSLCTSTRPYHAGIKWKTFVELFGETTDMLVVSNGGLIPRQYWHSYPFKNYDGKSQKDTTKEYQTILRNRLEVFIKKHPYDYVLANFRPNLRNTPVTKAVLADLKAKRTIKDYAVVPDEMLYESARIDGFEGPKGMGKMFPDLHQLILDALGAQLKKWS
jgi:hypothetical protein